VIRADPMPFPSPTAAPGEETPVRPQRRVRAERTTANHLITQRFPPLAAPAWARASGRAGQGEPLFFAGAALALFDACLRRDPPSAGALRCRLALMSAAASAKILRLNADEGALRDLRFAVGDDPGPAAKLLRLWRDLAARPPSLDPSRLAAAAARLDLALPDPNGLASSLKACAGEGDPVSAAAKAAAAAFDGLVPVDIVKKVLAERPPIAGVTLAGMPTGAPGMPGVKKAPFKIYAFTKDGKAPTVYAVE
jgi:Protein of unknown function (DUF1403)/Protein of unknown function, DUF